MPCTDCWWMFVLSRGLLFRPMGVFRLEPASRFLLADRMDWLSICFALARLLTVAVFFLKELKYCDFLLLVLGFACSRMVATGLLVDFCCDAKSYFLKTGWKLLREELCTASFFFSE